jgi:hypothetical protein
VLEETTKGENQESMMAESFDGVEELDWHMRHEGHLALVWVLSWGFQAAVR